MTRWLTLWLLFADAAFAPTITNIVYVTNYDACIADSTPPTPDMGNRIGIVSISGNAYQSSPLRTITFHGTYFSDYLLFSQGWVTNVSLPELTNQTTAASPAVDSISISKCTNTLSISAPLLLATRNLNLSINAALTNIGLASLQFCMAFSASNNAALASLSLPALTNTVASLIANNATALTSVSLPLWTPSNTCAVSFTNCALTANSVNHVLDRCVANAGYVSGAVNLSGGTSAAPTGQGSTDKATLTGRGVSVTTN